MYETVQWPTNVENLECLKKYGNFTGGKDRWKKSLMAVCASVHYLLVGKLRQNPIGF